MLITILAILGVVHLITLVAVIGIKILKDAILKNQRECFVFDIDGTLATKTDRGHFDEHKVYTDIVIEPVAMVLKALSKNHKIIFLSGRTEGCYSETSRWIQDKLGIKNPELYMRQKGDYRNDAIVKKEIYDLELLPKYTIVGVFDDRLRVCRMLYEKGLFCFNVNQGLKEF